MSAFSQFLNEIPDGLITANNQNNTDSLWIDLE